MVPRTPAPSQFKETSISEFFEKNRHILGFDSPQKSLFMVVKEAVDNSLDACEEYQILPEVLVEIRRLQGDELLVIVEDNGIGIERKQVPNVFGRLLYGSRFGTLRQSRGQQGIGITAAILYGQITTAKPSLIRTKIESEDVAYEFRLGINVKENRADIKEEKPVIWDVPHGTRVEIPIKGKYQTGKQSVFEYLKESAIVNPNADFIFIDPDGKKSRISRVIDRPSALSRPIKPHPTGLEIGEITGMIRENENYSLKDFLIKSLSRVSERTVEEICAFTSISPDRIVSTLSIDDLKKLIESFRSIKFPPPPTDCLAPLGVEFIRRGLKNIYGDQQPLYYGKPIQRPVSVYNGNPFSVEVGIVFGGNLPADEQVRVVRFANKVPLLYQQGACAITKAVSEMDWRGYGLDQRGGKGVPFGPAIIMVHVFGISLPFTSESKEAIAGIEQISEEVTSALKSAARGVRAFINKKEKRAKIMERFVLVEKIIPEIGEKCSMILGEKVPDMSPVLSKIANVVFVTEDVQKQQDSFRITVTVANFTTKDVNMELYCEPPGIGSPSEVIRHDIAGLRPSSRIKIELTVPGSFKEYPGTNFYFKGLDPVWVQGAELLPPDYFTEDIKIEDE